MLTDLERLLMQAHHATLEVAKRSAENAIHGLSFAIESGKVAPEGGIAGLRAWWAEDLARIDAELNRVTALLAASPTH